MRLIEGVATSTVAFVDSFRHGPLNEPVRLRNLRDFERELGGLDARSLGSYAVWQFFANGGTEAWAVRVGTEEGLPGAGTLLGERLNKTGLYALEKVDVFNVLCIPRAAELGSPDDTEAVIAEAERYCAERRAFLIVDIPKDVNDVPAMQAWMHQHERLRHPNAAVYFPRVLVSDPLNGTALLNIAPSGTLAGVYAQTDARRGVWESPAGIATPLRTVRRLAHRVTEQEAGVLQALGVNDLRELPAGAIVCGGARTLEGADGLGSDWKYIPVRRVALFLEASISRGTSWTMFEPNAEPLWAEIRAIVGDFMNGLFSQGAFKGGSPQQAYLVRCDRTTMTQDEIDQGIVNIVVGFAPLRPAEFVILNIRQIACPTG